MNDATKTFLLDAIANNHISLTTDDGFSEYTIVTEEEMSLSFQQEEYRTPQNEVIMCFTIIVDNDILTQVMINTNTKNIPSKVKDIIDILQACRQKILLNEYIKTQNKFGIITKYNNREYDA